MTNWETKYMNPEDVAMRGRMKTVIDLTRDLIEDFRGQENEEDEVVKRLEYAEHELEAARSIFTIGCALDQWIAKDT